MKKYRVIQWFTGEIARHQIRLVASTDWLELVGAFVFHEEKVGLDAGTLAGINPLDVITTNNMDDMLEPGGPFVVHKDAYALFVSP